MVVLIKLHWTSGKIDFLHLAMDSIKKLMKWGNRTDYRTENARTAQIHQSV